MKRIFVHCFLGAILAALCAGSVATQDIKKLKFPPVKEPQIPEVTKVVLDNGLRLYMLEDHTLPVFNMSVLVNGGSYLEPAEKIGLASITGQVLRTGGTAKYTGDQIDEMLESVGASIETYIGLASGGASVSVLSDNTDMALDILTEILRYPTFAQDKLDLVKVSERSGISRRNDDPEGIGSREFDKIIYGANSVFARHTEYATIDAIKREDLQQFHQTFFVPNNIQIAVWGDFSEAAMVDKLKAAFGEWARGSAEIPKPPKVDYTFDAKVYLVDRPEINQSKIYMGHLGGLVTDPTHPARIVMNNILGTSYGSRLFSQVRSKEGLAYDVFGVYSANISYPGKFFTYASTKSETTAKAIDEMLKQIKGIQDIPPTPHEMSLGKDGYLNSFVFNYDARDKVINRMMTYDFWGLPADFLEQQKVGVEKVSAADVVAAAKTSLHPDQLRILVVGNSKDFEKPLDQLGLGPVETIDVTIPSGAVEEEVVITPEALEKGKALLDKAIASHGSAAGYKKIKGLALKGTWVLSTPQGDFPIALDITQAYPNRHRVAANMMGQTIYDIRNGEVGWKSDQTGQLVDKSAEDIAKDVKELYRDPLFLFSQWGSDAFQALYAGEGQVNGVAVEQVKIVSKDGETIATLGFDPKTGRLASRTYWGETPFGEGIILDQYSEFKKVSGVEVPTATVSFLNGQKFAATTFTTVTVNPTVGADDFNRPS